jgi:hypothetical protein
MQLDVGSVKSIAGVVTQGRANAHQWVTSYTVEASDDEKAWTKVDCGRTFAGNVDHTNMVNGRFNKPITARYIRIFVRTWYGWPSLRAGVLLCDANYAQRKPSSWEMRVYKANGDMWDLPDVSTLTYVGTGKPKYIDFKDVNDIRKFVPGVPEKNFAAIVTGTVEIRTAGEYKFCGQSSDGAILAALAVSAQAGYLRDLKEEAAPKNRVVKTFQFPATLLVSERHPAGSHPTLAVPEA